MSYSAYERSAGSALDKVEAFCKQYTLSGAFNTSTQPTLVEVEAWLTTRYHTLMGIMGEAGYELTPTDAEVLGVLEDINVAGVVMNVELAHPISGQGEENQRWKAFERMWKEGLALVKSGVLSRLGASRTGATPLVGGVSVSRKDVLRDDTDAVRPRFIRGVMDHPALPSTPTEERDIYQ